METFLLNILEQQLDTDLKEKLYIVSLLEFYINYLARKKYKQILIYDITFCKYVGMYLHIREAIFKYKKFTKGKIRSSLCAKKIIKFLFLHY